MMIGEVDVWLGDGGDDFVVVFLIIVDDTRWKAVKWHVFIDGKSLNDWLLLLIRGCSELYWWISDDRRWRDVKWHVFIDKRR